RGSVLRKGSACWASLYGRMQNHDRRAQMRVVVKRIHERDGAEQRLHVRPLHADAPPMDEPHLAEAASPGLLQVFASHVAHFVGAEGMKIENVLDRDLD